MVERLGVLQRREGREVIALAQHEHAAAIFDGVTEKTIV